MSRAKFASRFIPAVVVLAFLPGVRAAWAEAPSTQPAREAQSKIEPAKFMRFVDNGATGSRLETADVAYQNSNGTTVHLIAAVHIGEASYYEALNREFASYDAVLYEMVKPKDVGVPTPGERSDNPISQVQRFMTDALNLTFQLDGIDYSAPNFVHADLDKETFERLQEERGETFQELLLKQVMKAMTQPAPDQADNTEADPNAQLHDLVKVLTRPDSERQIKLFVAKQLDQIEMSAAGLGGGADGSVIVTERDKKAMQVLSDTLAKGKKNIAIFYGAAHMPDMSDRLKKLGFKPTSTDWHMAWDLTIRPDQPSAVEKLLDQAIDAMNDPAADQ